MCGKGVQQTSQQVAYPSLPAASAYSSAMDRIAQATSQPFQKYSSDPEAYVASLTPTQRGAISSVSGLKGMTDPYYQGATGLTLAGAGPVGRLTGAQIGEYMNPYMSQVVDPVKAALGQQFGMQQAQQQAEAIRGGAFGGERSGLQRAVLRGQQGLALGQALSPLFAQGYGQALQTAQGQQAVEAANLQRLLGAGQQLGGLGTAAQQAALQQASAQLQAGTLEQQTETAQKQALYNEFQKQRMYPLQTAQLYAQAAGGLGPLMGSTSMGYQAMPFFGGFAADGGAIKGYDDGLGAARMGGAVDEPGDYSRGGYAYGGDTGFEDIAAQHRAALGIGQQQQDVAFPTADIRPAQQLRAELPEARTSGGLGSMLTKGADAARRGIAMKEAYDKPGHSYLDMAKAALGVTGQPEGKAEGGDVHSDAMQDLLSNPIQVSKPQQPQQAPEKQKSGLGGLLKAGAGMAANYFLPGSGPLVSAGLGAMGMADGGRAGYQEGGPSEDDFFRRGIQGAESARRQFDKYGRTLTSPKGAEGISQIMPGTGPEAAKLAGLPYDRQRLRTDEEYNTALGNAYYNKQLKDFGTEELAAAAYNAGPGRVRQALARAEREGGDVMSYLPAETRKYVPTVMRKAGLSQDAIGENIAGLGPRERAMMALYKGEGAKSAARKEPGFVENVTEHPERLIVPILQGLGAMAGSKSRYAGSAILEGLGAGAGSYLETGKALEEQRKTHEEADLLRASGLEAGATAFKTLREMPIWVNPANPGQSLVMTSSGAVMDLNVYLSMQNPPPLMGAQEASLAAQQLGLREKGATQAGYAPEGGTMPTGVGAARQAGLEEETDATTAPEVTSGVPQKQITPAPKPMTYVGINIGEAAASAPAQERSFVNSLGGRAAFETSQEIRRNINQQGSAARAQSIYNAQVAQIISEAAAAKGFEAMGDYSEPRARVVNSLNTIARGLGYGDTFFGQNESRQQMLEKLNSIRGEATVMGAGQPAYKSLETVISSMPGTGQTPRAGSFNAASNLVQNQKRIDYQNYANAYGQRTGNLYNNVEDAFASDNADDKYQREEEAFQKIISNPNGSGSKIIGHFMKGEKPDGSKATRADIDAFFKNNFDLDGMSRYFMGARGG